MKVEKSSLISAEQLETFEHRAKATVCHGCANGCRLTVNTFSGGRRFISGNRCERPLHTGDDYTEHKYNLYEYKRELITSLTKDDPLERGRALIGIPLALGIYETAPLWHGIFKNLGFSVKFSEMSRRSTYEKGQFTIPSDTACYPAKLMHGHVQELIDAECNVIFPVADLQYQRRRLCQSLQLSRCGILFRTPFGKFGRHGTFTLLFPVSQYKQQT